MPRYVVTIKAAITEARSFEDAAAMLVQYLRLGPYQPRRVEVADIETGEVVDIEVSDMRHGESPEQTELFGAKAISDRLRSPAELQVLDSHYVENFGTVVVVRICSGVVRKGDPFIAAAGLPQPVTVSTSGIERGGKMLSEAYFGEEVGILFKAVDLRLLRMGSTLHAVSLQHESV